MLLQLFFKKDYYKKKKKKDYSPASLAPKCDHVIRLWLMKCKLSGKCLKGGTANWDAPFLSSFFILTAPWNAEMRAGALAAILACEVPLGMNATTKDSGAD